MSGYKDILKNGWHPEKEGTTLKDQMKSLVGRGDKNECHSNHVAAPISSLRDPSSFGPPPRHVNTGSPVPVAPSSTSGFRQPALLPAPAHATDVQRKQQEGEAAPPKQYRVDTTGLSTAHLPPPPVRRNGGADGRNPSSAPPPPYSVAKANPPSLPPRLPPRAGAGSPSAYPPAAAPPPRLPDRSSTPSTPAQSALLNHGAMNRLGGVGVSVPGLGGTNITGPPTSPGGGDSKINTLQSRFAKLGTSPGLDEAPKQGTTLSQKQAAFKTAAAFQQDPSSVSVSDARAAVSTADNFRKRHGDQAMVGLQSMKSVNEKYRISDKIENYTGSSGSGASQAQPSQAPIASATGLLSKKKPAPPPPQMKSELGYAGQDGDDAPPPVPMNTRPQF